MRYRDGVYRKARANHHGTITQRVRRWQVVLPTQCSLSQAELGASPTFLAENYPWSSIGDGAITIVGSGGSKGHVSLAIAEAHPEPRFIVQDLPNMVRGAGDSIPRHFKERITFMEHDFFSPQTVEADVYLFRNIFHNWSDERCVHILKQLIPVLERGARIVINDAMVPEVNAMQPSQERRIRFAAHSLNGV